MALRSPLFDIYDPGGILRQQAQLAQLPEYDEDIDPFGVAELPVRRPQLADLMPEEEKRGMLRGLAEAGTSGLSAAGYILDTPGALVRGILAGDPLSVFGDSDRRVTGRELLRQYGLAGNEDNWWNFGGGMAAEMLLDPLTYLNPLAILGRGALSPTGKALKASGMLRNAAETAYEGFEPTLQQAAAGARARPAQQGVRMHLRNLTPEQAIAESADPAAALARYQTQARRFGVDPNDLSGTAASLMDVRVPGTNIGFSTDILGRDFGDAVAGGLDDFGEWLKRNPYTGPGVSGFNALFHAPSGMTLNPDVQWDSRIAKVRAQRANEAQELLRTRQMREAMGVDAEDVAAQMRASGAANVPANIPDNLRQFQSTDIQRALVDFAESPVVSDVGPIRKTSGDPLADWVLENVPQFRDIRDTYTGLEQTAQLAAREAGLPEPRWASTYGTQFFPRQSKWWQRAMDPDRPNAVGRVERPYSQGERILNTTDNFGRQRREYTDIPGGQRTFRMLTGNADPALDSAALQASLIGADQIPARGILNQAFDTLGVQRPFQEEVRQLLASPEYRAASRPEQRAMLQPVLERMRGNQDELVNLLRGADQQFAQTNTGLFDTPGWTNLRRYETGQNKVVANAGVVADRLSTAAQPIGANGLADGMVPLTQAADRLGFDANNFRRMWQRRFNQDVTNFSVPENLVAALGTLAPQSRLSVPESGLLGAVDQFTNAFKVGALASPAFHVRNTYSGAINAASLGAFNPLDMWAAWRASHGNTAALARRLEKAPGFAGLTPDERVARFLDMTGANRVSGGTVMDDITGLPEQELRGTWLGSGNEPNVLESLSQLNPLGGVPNRKWGQAVNDFFRLRGVGFNPSPRNTNPILMANDAMGRQVEDALRAGTFLNQIRKGVDPGEAADLMRMAQVDYAPDAFSSFERNVMKRALPFYSFAKGILPSIKENLLYQPGGLMGKSIRLVSRGTQPTEDNFIPEHLRHSAAIPLPADLPGILGGSGKEGLQRYLTNIDLPWESTLQLLTPGIGATMTARIADTLRKTGSNIAGQTNPLIKAPLEYVTNRQLYSGRDLSDLYSVLERDLGDVGRPLEQAIVNFLPFGARGLGLYRQLTDDRLDPADKYTKAAWNLLAGAKLTDIDQERSKQLAAREMLNQMLMTTPGVRTYENVTVPDDVLRTMPEEQRRQYLLYKIVQASAAKRARDRKKQEAGMDPMQMLGIN